MRQGLASRVPAGLRRAVQRPEWLAGFAAAGGLCLLSFAIAAAVSGVRAGNAWGAFYGSLATLLFVALMLLGARRRSMRLGWGRAQDWVQLHVYGGVLFLLLVLLHTGFSLPRSRLTAWLLALSLWVVGSGLTGVVLRKWIPRVLTSGLADEVLYERIPELVAEVRRRAEQLVAGCSPPLQDLYRRRLAAELAAPRVRWRFLIDITGGIHRRTRELAFLKPLLPAQESSAGEELEALVRSKLELDAHYTLQRLLRGWPLLHVPVSIVLALLVAVHLWTVFYY